jgi:alpha-2-macroglobulin
MNASRFLLILALAAHVLSCSRDEADLLRVTSALPSGIVQGTSVLTIAFSRAVVPPDSANLWTSTPYIEFTPAIAGKFVWQDTSHLVFSPDQPLAGDTRFRARLNTPLLVTMSGARAFRGDEEFTFSTQSFTLTNAEFFYDRVGQSRQVGIKANLEFTYAVNPEDVAKFIKLSIDGQRHPIDRVTSPEKSKVIALEVGVVQQLQQARHISIDFESDLISAETNTHIRMDHPFVVDLPGLEEMKIYGHEFGFDGTTSWIRVRTSQEVDQQSVKAHIVLNPAREYTLQSDNQGFTLRGKFEPGSTFRMVVTTGLESVLGGKTQNDYEADIVIGNIQPSFRFSSASGVYMLMGGELKLELRTVNLPKLLVRVSQVFQNNLVFFLDGGRSYDYYYDEYADDEGGRYQRKFRYWVGNYGRQLRNDTLSISSPTNQEVSTLFDLNPFLNNGFRGFFLVEIADPKEAWRSTSKLVSVSDIGLIVKQSADEVLVFAVGLSTARPMSGVSVSLISTNNQTIATEKTGGDGVAKFSGYRERAKDFALKLVTAEAGDDFNFINLEDYRVETSRYDVAGKRDAAYSWDAMIYGDRNIYRPGEKVVLSAVVRNLTHDLPDRMPVRLTVINPQGTTVSEQQTTLNDHGSFEAFYQTQPSSLTGEYRAELYTGNNLFLTSYRFSVEDFVPDRLKVSLTASTDVARPGDKIRYAVQALNFFGPPAAGRHWEFEGSFDVLPYRSKNFPDFRFYDDAATVTRENPEVFDGTTDAEGMAKVEFEVPRNVTSPGLLRGKGRVAVFDESGRPVYQISQTTIYPKDYLIGLRNYGAYYVSPNTPQKVEIVAVDMQDRPINGFKAKVDLVRYEWHSVLRQHPGTNTLRYVSERREILVRSDAITLGEKPTEYTYVTTRSGDYSLRISKSGDSGYNQITFYSYSWGTTDITSFEVDPEARVEVVFDKPLYAPGDKAKVLFQTPFNGTLLVTVERNGIFSYRYLTVANNAASMEVTIDDNFLPNVYVSAVLFRNIKEMNIPLMAGHGFAPLMVEKKSNRLEVVIKAPEKIRPKTRQRVTVTAGGEKNVMVTLAAVDEGICQLKNYKAPDPYGYFYAKKALETETFDFFKHLIPEPEKAKQASSTGGGEAEMTKRVNPLGVQRFKPLAIWSGLLRTNSSGEAEVTLDVPEFSGELRLMAFAYKGDRFGSAERGMKVADPVVITPALPRFLSPGDSITMAVTAFNTTDKPVSLKFDVETSGPVTAIVKSASLELEANRERLVQISLRATNQIGKAVITVRTEAFGEAIESATELPVRPVAPFAADAQTGFVDGGGSTSLEVADAYLPYGRRAYLTLSPFPVTNFAKELKYLIGYPHGCIEQTVSKAFPQIYLRDIAMIMAPSLLNTGSPTYFVNEAITKLTSMQLPGGSFAYWPGGGEANDWSTVYATHFLLEARKAGYAVPESMTKAALGALAGIARSKRTYDYSYSPSGSTVAVKRIADKACIYALYVLANSGVPEKAVMDFYRGERSLLTTDTRYLLAAAYALSGDRSTYTELLPSEFLVERAQRTSGWDFDSPVRANALILNLLLDIDLNNPAIPQYMEYLSKTYRGGYWFSTQDNAFTLLAFGKAARMASAAKVEGKIVVGGKTYAYGGGNAKYDLEPYGKTVSIDMQGQGRVYYSLVVEGIRSDGAVRIEDKSLQVRREFFDRNGSPVNAASVRQNDLLIVRLTLNSSVDKLENVAVTDLLPAGLEIENPRVTETTNYPFIKNPTQPEYMDIRDDRINLYTSFRGGSRQQQFYYLVRAVTLGSFQYAPVTAEAMYDANYYSASGQGKMRVGK